MKGTIVEMKMRQYKFSTSFSKTAEFLTSLSLIFQSFSYFFVILRSFAQRAMDRVKVGVYLCYRN